ncbi:NCS2 family permease [Clostridiales bacterium COT073_COT-073]|nr:NCS2 family permease [Clostridiales bacterium COT073_COT-073]
MTAFFEKYFKLKENSTSVRQEAIAGFTTFMTMAYILIVNPLMLTQDGATGMDFGKVFTATALSAVVGTLVMAFLAKLPFALAPGMGLNAFFVFTVIIKMGQSYQFALTAVFLEGLIFLLLSFFNVREAIIKSIPINIKKAVSVGIGLFIAFIGLSNAGIVVNGATPLELGKLSAPAALLTLIGLLVTGILLCYKVKGALFISIIISTIIGIPMGLTQLPELSKIVSLPSIPYFFDFEWHNVLTGQMAVIVLTFLFVDIFDTVGTLVGVSAKAKMLDENGNVPRAKQALLADAIATTFGAITGTSTVTTYVESAAGVAEGGRTGLTSVFTALLFAVALFLSPLFIMIPAAATAPALIIVGLFMMEPVKEINLTDFTEGIPAFLTMIMMPLTYSISEGIIFGIVSYVLLKLAALRWKEIPLITFILGIAFIVYQAFLK